MTSTTQRRLILIRHAKASEDDAGGDHTRTLAPRGREDAAALGVWLGEQNAWPDMVMCSTATRTRETLASFNRNLPTLLRDKLYLASANDMLAQIRNCDDAVTTLAVVGHNPGVHGLLALLVSDYAHDADAERVAMKFPTAACAILTLDLASWADLEQQTARLEQLRWAAEN